MWKRTLKLTISIFGFTQEVLHTWRSLKRSATLLKVYSNPGTERRLEPIPLNFHIGALSAMQLTIKCIQLPFKVFSTFILYFKHLSRPRDVILANEKNGHLKRDTHFFYEPESLVTQKKIAVAPVFWGVHHILQTASNYSLQYSNDASLWDYIYYVQHLSSLDREGAFYRIWHKRR